MTVNGWLQIALYCVVVLLVKPFGGYMTKVFNGERTLLTTRSALARARDLSVCGVDEKQEQHWVTYAVAMLFFTVAGFVTLYALQRLQGVLPFNPAGTDRGRAEISRSTPRSASSPTPTGSPTSRKRR